VGAIDTPAWQATNKPSAIAAGRATAIRSVNVQIVKMRRITR
jgi:hypothetical protein